MDRPTLLKSGGGPGSGKSRDSTAPIERLDKSPLVTLHRRKKIINHRSPEQTGKDLSIGQIDYGAQSTYDVEKLGWMLSNVEEWEEDPVQVVRIEGDHHLMDGHHRVLAADRLGMNSIKADVYVMDEDEVRRVTGQKNASVQQKQAKEAEPMSRRKDALLSLLSPAVAASKDPRSRSETREYADEMTRMISGGTGAGLGLVGGAGIGALAGRGLQKAVGAPSYVRDSAMALGSVAGSVLGSPYGNYRGAEHGRDRVDRKYDDKGKVIPERVMIGGANRGHVSAKPPSDREDSTENQTALQKTRRDLESAGILGGSGLSSIYAARKLGPVAERSGRRAGERLSDLLYGSRQVDADRYYDMEEAASEDGEIRDRYRASSTESPQSRIPSNFEGSASGASRRMDVPASPRMAASGRRIGSALGRYAVPAGILAGGVYGAGKRMGIGEGKEASSENGPEEKTGSTSPPIIAQRKYYSHLNDKMVTVEAVGDNTVELSTDDASWTERPDAVREKIREGDWEKTDQKPVDVKKEASSGQQPLVSGMPDKTRVTIKPDGAYVQRNIGGGVKASRPASPGLHENATELAKRRIENKRRRASRRQSETSNKIFGTQIGGALGAGAGAVASGKAGLKPAVAVPLIAGGAAIGGYGGYQGGKKITDLTVKEPKPTGDLNDAVRSQAVKELPPGDKPYEKVTDDSDDGQAETGPEKEAAFGLGRVDLPIDRLFRIGKAIQDMGSGSSTARKMTSAIGDSSGARKIEDLHARMPVGGQSGAGGTHDWGTEIDAPDEVNELYQARKMASTNSLSRPSIDKEAYGGFLLGDFGKKVVPELDDIKVPYPDTPGSVNLSSPPSKTGPVGPKDGTSMSMDEAVSSSAQESSENLGESLSAGGVLGVGLGGAGLAAGSGTDEAIDEVAYKEAEKEASVRSSIVGGTAGGAAGAGLNYAKQKGQIRSGTQEQVDPYRLGRAGVRGAVAGSLAPSVVRLGRRVKGGVQDLSQEAKRTMSEARKASKDMQDAADDLKEINRNISSGAGNAEDFMARMNELADEISETNQSFDDLAQRAKNNRFFGLFSKESSAASAQRKEASKKKLADAFVQFANKTDAPSPSKFESFLQDVDGVPNPTVRARPEKLDGPDMTGDNVVFAGDGGGAEMWEVSTDEGRQLVPGIKSGGEELEVPDKMPGVADTTDANQVSEVSPVDLSRAESTGGTDTEFRVPLSDEARADQMSDAIIGAGLTGAAGYGGYEYLTRSDGQQTAQKRKYADQNGTITTAEDEPSLFEEGFDFDMPDPEMPEEMEMGSPDVQSTPDMQDIDPESMDHDQGDTDVDMTE